MKLRALLYCAVLISASATCLHLPDALAQGAALDKARPRPYRVDPAEFQVEVLRSAPDLPYVAHYTGNSTFRFGTICPNTQGGSTLTGCWSVKEDPRVVHQWYASALPSYQWQLDPADTRIMGTHSSGNRIQIVFNAPSLKGYSTDIIIKYYIAKQPAAT